jgi:hypothetical protein
MDIPRKKLDKEKLYKFGERSENILYNIIKQYRDDVILTERYNNFDYIIETDDKIVLIELKTRTHLKGTFDTTYLPLSKIAYYTKFKKQNANKKTYLIVVFGFPLDIKDLEKCNFEYHAIQYKPPVFNNYIITNNPYDDDKNFNISVNDLRPFEVFLNIFKDI